MIGVARIEREISDQSFSVSGMDRTDSRTMVPPILLTQNRHPHRRWRGRFAVPDPPRSIPGAPSCLSDSGGNHGFGTAYRRTACRACEHQRRSRNSADRGRIDGGAGGTGPALAAARLTRHGDGRSGAAGALLLLSPCSRMADSLGFRAFEAGRSRSARLKLDPAGGIKSLSAHHYFTRQASGGARQGSAKSLILLMVPRDSLIRRYSSDQHCCLLPCSRSGEARQ